MAYSIRPVDAGDGGMVQHLMHQAHPFHGSDLAIVDGDPGALLPTVLDDAQRFA